MDIMEEKIIVRLHSMSHDGRAIGRYENGEEKGIAVFVENAVMGQTVQAKIIKKKKKYIEAQCEQVIKQENFVTKGICSHFSECGGCAWQLLDYQIQAKEKEHIVFNSLHRIGGVAQEFLQQQFYPILTPLNCEFPKLTAYRNKMEFAFSLENGKQKLGLRKRNSHKIIEITDCKLMNKKAMEILSILRDITKDYTEKFLRYAVIRNFNYEWTVELITYPFSKYNEKLEKRLINLCYEQLQNKIKGMIHSIRKNSFDIAYGEEIVELFGNTKLVEELTIHNQTYCFSLGNTAFFQVNTQMTEILYSVVYELASLVLPKENGQLWDIYCGLGSIGLSLAPLLKQNKKQSLLYSNKIESSVSTMQYKKPFLLGVEVVEQAIQLAKQNALNLFCDFARFETNSAKKLEQYFKRFSLPNVLILDPPRAGVEEQAIQAILKYLPPNIIYVSCNPATLARDLALLSEKYQIVVVQPVDLFPHTPHVETVVLLFKLTNNA